MEGKILSGKKILMVIAFRDFRDEEYFVPKKILKEAGAEINKFDSTASAVEIKTASNEKGIAIGSDGGQAKVDLLVSEVNSNDFDAVLFVGGPGCLKNLDNENSYRLSRKMAEQNKIVAAICVAPLILAKAGILKGRQSAVWSSPLDKRPIEILKDCGAIYKAEKVVKDGRIITANGPEAATEFANILVENLK